MDLPRAVEAHSSPGWDLSSQQRLVTIFIMLAPLLMKAGLQSVTASQHLVTILLHLAVQNMLLQEKMLKQADLKKGGNRQMETKSASIPPA